MEKEEWEREDTDEGLKVRPRRTRSDVFEEASDGNIAVEHEQEQERAHETINGDVAIDKDKKQEKGDSETCVYLDKDKGTDSKGESVSTKVNGVGTLTGEKEIENGTISIETKSSESQNGLQNSDGGDHLGSLISIYNGHQKEAREKSEPTDSSMGANTNGGPVNYSKIVVDLDVEHVIKEQETHDLICPNCRANITKRVILRKRKRIAPSTAKQEKPNKQPTFPQPHEEAPAPTATNEDQETERTVFRCLSCFSFFILTGTGFRLFPCFRRNAGSGGLQSPQQEDLNCISSILELFRGKQTAIVSGNGNAHTEIRNSMNENDDVSVLIANGDRAQVGSENVVETTDVNSAGSGTTQNGIEDKLNLLRPGRETIPDQSLMNSNVPPLRRLVSSSGKLMGSPQAKPTEEGTLTASRGPQTSTLIEPLLQPDTIIPIAENRLGDSKTSEWDVIKSIVYGGLAESITSLGVVSSAAGSDATTVNIVALGLANLITGLFVVIHNLRELKKEHDSTNEQEKIDRYEETLGKAGNFALHATTAVLSYILFGLLPPVVYGFSFRKSDNKEYKLIAVAAASLLCVILLAIGKAYTQKLPKSYVKTVLYYVSTGVAASGLSYAVGVLIHRALAKLGWFDSSAAAPSVATDLAFLETIPMKSGWAAF